MKKLIILLLLIATAPIFGQSSSSAEFEINLIVNKNRKDFENMQMYYISGTGITNCQLQIDSTENSNYCSVKLYGSYVYFGGGNAIFPTFIISETKNNVIQNYLIKVDFSAGPVSNIKTSEPKINQIAISLYPSQPVINAVHDENKSLIVRNYEFLSEVQSIKENKYFFIDMLTWTKIIFN
ncbi:MAG: hypothetical protein Q8M29_09945 [Bacteroidota bacterium]|nr:hypothetical protein [Bacteroidota bacterium]